MTTAAQDPAVDTVAEQGEHGRKRWFALGFMSLGVSMAMIDATIVNVSIPVISEELSLTPSDIEWVNSIYALIFASVLITMGKLGDLVGRRLMFVVGAAVFLGSSLIAARSNSGEVLISARFLQGIGGAMMIPASLSLLNAMFRGKERAIAFAVWGATIGAVAAAGPLLGGWLTTDFGWRWAFLINVPVATLLIIGTLLLVPESKDPHAERGFDLLGCLTSSLGLGAVVFGLIEGQRYGWWSPIRSPRIGPFDWGVESISPVPVAFLLGAALLVAFLRIERRKAAAGRPVLLDLELFRIPSFSWGNLAGALIMFGEFGLLLAIPLFLQNVLGFTAIGAGAVLVFIMLGALVSTPVSPRLVHRFGAIRVVRAGLALEVVMMIVLGFRFGTDTNTWTYAPWLFLYGIGVGFSVAQLTNVVLRDVPVQKSGQASGTQSTARQLGIALGVAVLGAVLWTSLSTGIESRLEQRTNLTATERSEVARTVVDSTGVVLAQWHRDPDRAEVAQVADEAYAEATGHAVWVGAGFMLLGLVGTFRMRPPNRPEDDGAGPVPAGAEA